jgi:hypothetical protein
MRIVSEQEINQAVMMSDFAMGLTCAGLSGLVMAFFWWFCLAIGVG